MKQVLILGGLLAASLVGSYLTWTSDDEAASSEGVVVVSAKVADLRQIDWKEEKKSVVLLKKKDDAGEYMHVTVVEQKEINKPPPAQPAEGEEPTPPPEPQIETITKVFVGNAEASELWESFAPLKGLRELTLTPDSDPSAFGLDDPKGSLVIESGSTTTLMVGGEAYGTRDRYVKSGEKVYLVDDKTLRPLQFADTRLVERRLQGLEEEDITQVTVQRGADRRTFTQQNADDRAKAFWADIESPDNRDIEGATWLDKVFKLRAQAYTTPEDTPSALTPVLTFSTTGDGQAWTVEILEGSNDGTPGYYARSDFNRALVQLTRSLATEAVDDLDNLFDGKPGEEPAETPPADGTPG